MPSFSCKELIKELNDHLLAVTDALDVAHAKLHAVVEVVQLIIGAIESVFIQLIEHARHRASNDIALSEWVVWKQRIQHRLNHDVLGEHLHHIIGA